MSERVTMPALGESVTEGTVTRWLKNVGDAVAVDEPLLEVSTDKVDTEIPSPVAGTLQEILVQEDDTVPVGADLCVIGDGDAAPAAAAHAAEPAPVPAEEAAPQAAEPAASAEPEPEPAPAPAAADAPAAPASQDSDGEGVTVTMPALGESVTEGTVTRWLKQEGDEVAMDEPLLEVSTDKVDTEIPSPAAGVLTKIIAGEDSVVAVGGALALIGGSAPTAAAPAAAPAPAPAASAPAPAASPPAPAPAAAPTSSPAQGEGTPAYVTPLVRKLASQHGVELSTLTGTGVGGRIRKQDVLDAAEAAKKAAAAPAPAPAEPAPAPAAPSAAASSAPAATAPAAAAPSPKRGTTEKMSRLRKVIAERMVSSLAVSAQLTAAIEVDMTRVATLRAQAKSGFEQREGVKLTFLPFIALATVEALKAFPSVNASLEGDQIVYHGAEHLGIAVDTERGLLVPVIKDAGDLNIAGISRKIADLAERTRTYKVTPDELGGGTFTITNIGSNGSIIDTPIINQPQVAILGTGAIVKRPAVITDADGNDAIAIRSMMFLVLTYDHRVIDGALAGKFLTALKRRLEEGNFEAALG